MKHSRTLMAGLLCIGLGAGTALARDARVKLDDPFDSPMLGMHQVELLGDPANITYSPKVRVFAPASAEDSLQVPVTVDATGLDDVEKIVAFADFGPIPKILTYYPKTAKAKLSFRFKIDQATPVRAAVMTSDGKWYVGGTHIDAMGGGCTQPAQAYAAADWEKTLGQTQGRLWPSSGRMRVIVDHPMDTGLSDGIPVFIIEKLALKGPGGQTIANMELHEPVSEDPAFTVHLNAVAARQSVRMEARDNNGNRFRATIRALTH